MRVIRNLILITTTILLLLFVFLNSNIVKTEIISVLKTWSLDLIPTLFPFLLLSTYLSYTIFPNIVGKILTYPNRFLFKTYEESSSFIFLSSIISGSPTQAFLIDNMLKQKTLSIKEANNTLNFSSYINPLFIIAFIGIGYFKNVSITIILLVSMYASGMIIGIFANIHKPFKKPAKDYIADCNQITPSVKPLISDIILRSVSILYIILGMMILSTVIKLLLIEINFLGPITKLLPESMDKTFLDVFFYSLLEITTGSKAILLSNTDIYTKVVCIAFLINFLSLSVILQVYAALAAHKINFFKFFVLRLFQGIIASIITIKLFDKVYQPVYIETFQFASFFSNYYLIFVAITIILLIYTITKKVTKQVTK